MSYTVLPSGKYQCDICSKEYSKMGIGTHLWRAHGEGKDFKPTLNKIGLNKGKIFSLEHRKKLGDAHRGKQYTMTSEGRASLATHMAARMKKLYASGWQGPTFVKKFEYQSRSAGTVYVDGTWELRYCEYLDSSGIKWKRNTERFSYFDGQKIRSYCPDFFLLNENIFVEIKGRKTEIDDLKWASVPNLKILFREDLKLLKII